IRALRSRLGEANSLRNELLAALAVMNSSVQPPSDATLAVLRPSEIRNPDALGPRLARARAEGEGEAGLEVRVEVRVLFAPNGAVIARFYFDGTGGDLLLREEDTDGDGQPDLWTAYADGVRRDLWQDDTGLGTPNLHVTFAEDGMTVARVAIDAHGDGQVERVFSYEGGRLTAELRDTTGDGQLDSRAEFANDGTLSLREEDLDGDAEPDIRTHYRSGRMISREILNPAAVGSLD
ncbi:MAG: hypothetical protein JRG96_07565, partial [Deltaproteobacteria bacterium]|nr:hypothetical protein [Deltaproteobacteria bacterium]